jgi:formylglycine-generating enzyme required for sulfatase activity
MVRLFRLMACLVMLAACGYPPLPKLDLNDAPSVDAPSSDAELPSQVLSCTGLQMTCGSGSNDNCCNSPAVPGGSYDRSYDVAGDGNSGNTSYPATVSNFRLDKYEVTVGRFRAFVNAGMGTQTRTPMPGAGAHANIAGSGWDASWNASLALDRAALIAAVKCDSTYQTWTDTPVGNENRPMNCISWYEAMAFCAWDGGYLPTEAEWNYAATGGDQQRAYPWSSPAGSLTIDGSHASYDDGTTCVGDGMPGCAVTDLVSVGTKPLGNGRWGQSGLAGNVWEWALDWDTAYVNPCINCANLTTASNRVLRGGSFENGALFLRAGYRNYHDPMFRDFSYGVRCARTP